MPNPIETLPQTSIAAIFLNIGDSGIVRVFTQDINGRIRESRYEDGSWRGGTVEDVVTTAKLYSPIAVARGEDPYILRLFYLTDDNIIRGIILDWNQSRTYSEPYLDNRDVRASPVSRLAVVVGYVDTDQSLFYQKPDGSIGCLSLSIDEEQWDDAVSFGDKPLVGTGLTATNFEDQDAPGGCTGIRVYYQRSDGIVTDVGIDYDRASASPGDLEGKNFPPGANLAVISIGSPAKRAFQLFYLNKATRFSEGSYDDGTWHFETHPGEIQTAPSSGIAVVQGYSGSYRVYYQDETNQIVEFATTSLSAGGTKTVIPTGVVRLYSHTR